MFTATLTVDSDVLDAIAETAQNAPRAMRREAGIVARGPQAQAIIVALAREPGKPQYPLAWTSTRQRKAFFASNGFGHGIPYTRTHRLSQGWRVVLADLSGGAGGVLSVENSTPGVDFVQGNRMQTMHLRTGWQPAALVIRDHEEALQDALIDAWWRVNKVKP